MGGGGDFPDQQDTQGLTKKSSKPVQVFGSNPMKNRGGGKFCQFSQHRLKTVSKSGLRLFFPKLPTLGATATIVEENTHV